MYYQESCAIRNHACVRICAQYSLTFKNDAIFHPECPKVRVKFDCLKQIHLATELCMHSNLPPL